MEPSSAQIVGLRWKWHRNQLIVQIVEQKQKEPSSVRNVEQKLFNHLLIEYFN